jgi:hypothetical protein
MMSHQVIIILIINVGKADVNGGTNVTINVFDDVQDIDASRSEQAV